MNRAQLWGDIVAQRDTSEALSCSAYPADFARERTSTVHSTHQSCYAAVTQGGSVVDSLLNQGASVRVMTRAPKSSKAKALAQRGAHVVQGDLADKASLREVRSPLLLYSPMLADYAREVRVRMCLRVAAIVCVLQLCTATEGRWV